MAERKMGKPLRGRCRRGSRRRLLVSRVLGENGFQERLEKQLGRVLRRQTPS